MDRRKITEISTDENAVTYCRVSGEEQVKNFSLGFQEKCCLDRCEGEGWTNEKVFSEEGKTGRNDNRPQFIEAMSYCRKHKNRISIFLVWRFDRFSRDTKDYFVWKTKLAKMGIRLVSATQYSDGSPESELSEGVAVLVSKYESQSTGLRAKAGMTEARSYGHLTGLAPVGYLNSEDADGKKITIVDPDRGHLVAEAFKMFSKGTYKKKEVVDHINLLGYRSRKQSKQMTIQKLTHILNNRTYVGDVFVNEKSGYAPSAFESLVSREIFDTVQNLLSKNDPRSVKHLKANPDFPLNGTVKCHKCGKPITGSNSLGKQKVKKYPNYRCHKKKCGGLSIRKEPLECSFIELLEQLIPKENFLLFFGELVIEQWNEKQKLSRKQMKTITSRLDRLRENKQKLIKVYAFEGRIKAEDYDKEDARISSEIDTLELVLNGLESKELENDALVDIAVNTIKNVAVMWADGDIEQRKALQKALFPLGLLFSKEKGFDSILTPKGFNLLENVDSSTSEIAG